MTRKLLLAYAAVASLLTACQSKTPTEESCVDQKCVHKYGVEVGADYWNDCGRNGELITTQRDGVVIKQSYANGMLNGSTSYSFPHSEQPQKVEVYQNDELVSRITYLPSGMPLNSIEFISPYVCIEKIWYDSGNPKSVEKYEENRILSGDYYNLQGKRDAWVCNGYGERIVRDNFGCVLSIDDFKGGEMVSQTIPYPNGSPQEITSIANSVPHGERKTYYPGGEPMTIELWDNGLQHGQTIVFQNGEKYAEVPYVDGQKHGLERRYRDGCMLSQEVTWCNDQRHGPCYTYFGDTHQTDWYYNGKMSSRSNFESFALPKKGSLN